MATLRAAPTRRPRRNHPTLRDSSREPQSRLGFLAEVLSAGVEDRTDRRRTRRINDAKLPRLKRLEDFNIDAVPSIQAATPGHLAVGGYMDAGEPVVLLCDPGTGKPHLIIGPGLTACEQGRRVRNVTTHLEHFAHGPAILFESGQDDTHIPVEAARRFATARTKHSPTAGENITVHVAEGLAHIESVGNPDAIERCVHWLSTS